MGFAYSYTTWIFMLACTVFLLGLVLVNHSSETTRYRILKVCLHLLLFSQIFNFFRLQVICDGKRYPSPLLYVIFVGYYLCAATVMILIMMYMLLQFPRLSKRHNLLYSVFYLWECVTVILVMSNEMTGFVYSLEHERFLLGPAYVVFFVSRIGILAVTLVSVLSVRKDLSKKLFENWVLILLMGLVVHITVIFTHNLFSFDFYAELFLSTMFFLFHFGSYEEGNARMSLDMYRRELGYSLEKKRKIVVVEIKIHNYDRVVERRLFSETELDGLYGEFCRKLSLIHAKALVYQKKHNSLGLILQKATEEEMDALAAQMCAWMNELFAGQLVYGIVAAECPRYAKQFVGVERLLRYLQNKCEERNYHICDDTDYEEYCERESILHLLHDMRWQKQDVVLFARPVMPCKNHSEIYLEILCRLQVAGSGIVHSENVIDLAEKYGYIHDVNMAVLMNVCEFLTSNTAMGERIHVSLHVSGEELENPNFVDDVLRIVTPFGVPPQSIGFEVMMVPGEGDLDRIRAVINTLRDHQIMFTLVDFDPTCVNFESVMSLPFEMIKFERHCIIRASENPVCYDTMGMLVDLFKDHGFYVAFKGVDNEELEEVAMSLGPDYVQGEKYTKPFAVDHMAEQDISWSI